MSGDCIVWRLDSNMSEVDIKQCRVDIRKCTYMFGEERSGEEESSSHVDIKPCVVDNNQSSDSIMSSVNITVPLSVLKNIPVLTSLFAPILAPNVPVPPVAVGRLYLSRSMSPLSEEKIHIVSPNLHLNQYLMVYLKRIRVTLKWYLMV